MDADIGLDVLQFGSFGGEKRWSLPQEATKHEVTRSELVGVATRKLSRRTAP